MGVLLALEKLKQEDLWELEASTHYSVFYAKIKTYLKNNSKKGGKGWWGEQSQNV